MCKEREELFETLKKEKDGLFQKVRDYFELKGLGIDVEDDSGMTPLMHACWKGDAKLADFCLQRGADVNGGGNHDHGYTTLHFAALSGSKDVCKLLLESGVKIDSTNSVKRTASQMAGFVGRHECVSLINNFVPKEDVYYFTRKQPLEKEPKLPLPLAKPLYELVMNMNVNPVAIGIILKITPELLKNLGKASQILKLMAEREFVNRKDVNEVLALKFHIIHYILNDVLIQMEKDQKQQRESGKVPKTPFIDRWIKSMLAQRDENGFLGFQEYFLRQGIRQFPFQESQLFKVLSTSFAQGNGKGISAAECINQAFNGQKGFKDFEPCTACGAEVASKKCSACKSVQYCNQDCQKYDWFCHKKFCKELKKVD